MTSEDIYNQLKDIIKVYLPEDVSVENITEESHLIQELNINSAHIIDVVLDVEDTFQIEIQDNELQALDTVSNAIKLIQEKLNN